MVTEIVPVTAVDLSIRQFCTEFRSERFCDDDVFWIEVGKFTVGFGKLTVGFRKSNVGFGKSTVGFGKLTVGVGKSTVGIGKSPEFDRFCLNRYRYIPLPAGSPNNYAYQIEDNETQGGGAKRHPLGHRSGEPGVHGAEYCKSLNRGWGA